MEILKAKLLQKNIYILHFIFDLRFFNYFILTFHPQLFTSHFLDIKNRTAEGTMLTVYVSFGYFLFRPSGANAMLPQRSSNALINRIFSFSM